MPLNKLDATSQASTPAQAPKTAPAEAVATSTTPAANVDDLFAQPNPPRFPWLSNLGRMLESKEQSRFKFEAAPALGDKVDVRA